jgi:tetratricopeptide (TPR) repeat protein
MGIQKNILEGKVFIRFFVFALLTSAFLLVLFALQPSPEKSAYVNNSEYVKPYSKTVVKRFDRDMNKNKSLTQSSKVAKIIKKNKPVPNVEVAKSGVNVSGLGSLSSLDAMQILEKAITHVDSGDYQKARELLEAALEKDPTNEQLLVELGMIFLIDYRQPENAMPLLERALTQNPSNKVVLSELVGIYQETGNVDAGERFVRGLLEKDTENSELNLGLGQILLAENNMHDAVTYLEKAIEGGQTPDYVYADLAEVYSKIGKPEKAIQTYEAAVLKAQNVLDANDDPNFKELNEDMLDRSLLNLARELSKNGQLKEAESAINSILKRRPQQQEALYQLGKIYKQKG